MSNSGIELLPNDCAELLSMITKPALIAVTPGSSAETVITVTNKSGKHVRLRNLINK